MRELNNVLLDSNKNKSFCLVESMGKLEKIKTDDVLYIVADGRYTEIVTIAGTIFCNRSLGKWIKEENNLILLQTHRSYLVPIAKIKCLEKGIVTLDSGEKIPVSRRMYTHVEEEYRKYFMLR